MTVYALHVCDMVAGEGWRVFGVYDSMEQAIRACPATARHQWIFCERHRDEGAYLRYDGWDDVGELDHYWCIRAVRLNH